MWSIKCKTKPKTQFMPSCHHGLNYYLNCKDSFVNYSKDLSSNFSRIPISIFLRVPQMVHSIFQQMPSNNSFLISPGITTTIPLVFQGYRQWLFQELIQNCLKQFLILFYYWNFFRDFFYKCCRIFFIRAWF